MNHRAFVTFLTTVRAPLVLLGTAAALYHGCVKPSWVALGLCLVLLAASAITDMFDGKLARKWKVTSRFGALADPLMDKVFYAIALPAATFLAARNGDWTHASLLLALDIISMLRDQWVTFLRSVGSGYGADVRANWSGKLRTALGFPIICLAYLFLGCRFLSIDIPAAVRIALLALEGLQIAITLLSADTYTRQYAPYLSRSMKE